MNGFGTKAETLEVLAARKGSFSVLPLYKLSWKEWKEDDQKCIRDISGLFSEPQIIVRSSALNEDSALESNAGKYVSISKVDRGNPEEIHSAISSVFASYGSVKPGDQVFVQPYLSNIKYSGVAFTADVDTLAPYFVVNYNEGVDTSVVTGGSAGRLRTYIYFKFSQVTAPLDFLQKLVTALRELESIFNYSCLDVEFAVDGNGTLFILQVRPIVTTGKEDLSRLDFRTSLQGVYKKVQKLSSAHPNLLGNKAIFGVMPDWNPAEIIGIKPKQLAVSLYKELVTDNIWAYQRDNYGYRNLRSHPLMIMYLGIPYIDVRVDFNSFIPKTLNEKIAKKLVNYYLKKLATTPVLHDKVEFEIVHSCYYFNLPDKLGELKKAGFSATEITAIKRSLVQLTNDIINPKSGHYKKDVKKVELLKAKYDQIVESDLSLVDKIYWLIEDCKRYGTLPFAGIARSAFIATQFLRSLVDLEILSKPEYQAFLASVNTIAKQLAGDFKKLKLNKISKPAFLEKYGHLRPGTYDILSLRYDEGFENYFSAAAAGAEISKFRFSKKQMAAISRLIRKNGLKLSAVEMISFIKSAIEGREYAKYVFTRSLSKVLSCVEQIGQNNGISKEDMAFVDIRSIIQFYASLDNLLVKDVLGQEIERNKSKYLFTKAVKLPHLITRAEDVYSFFLSEDEPNFITLKKTSGEILKESDFSSGSFAGKIVFIRSADPGYDFLFSKNIAGLVTQYGGANSHMSIRCSELGIPAVIGCGEQNFSNWLLARKLELDCLNKMVRVIEN